jgi:phenylacetate-coenzyme A ligase PaaK-like adenylate-forming protein
MNLKIENRKWNMNLATDKNQLKNVFSRFIPSQNQWTPVDKALFKPATFFHDFKETQKLMFPAIKHSFHHHYTNNQLYHSLCTSHDITPTDIKKQDDIVNIPLLPDTFFKDYPNDKNYLKWLDTIYTGTLPTPTFSSSTPSHDDVIDTLNKHHVNIMFTSGTSGKFSFIPRDTTSWKRLNYSAMRSVVELMNYDPNDVVLLLIPDPRQTNLTIACLFGIAYELYNPKNIYIALEKTKVTTQFLRMQRAEAIGIREKIKAKALAQFGPMVQKKSDKRMIALMKQMQKEKRKINIAGPPFWLNRILERMKNEGIALSLQDSQVLTGGGWKAEEDKRSPEESFREKVEEILGIPQHNYHDVYAMSECSSVFLSCEGHYKHIPPVIYPMVLDDDLKPSGYNRTGRFAFIDPLPTSYPGFIITGDRVKILEHCPICNREGPVLDVEVTRMPGVEGRGCAAVMAELMQQEE